MKIKPIYQIAKFEFTSSIRNRWTLLFIIVFAVITLGISYFGMTSTGYTSYQSLNRTGISLINVVIFLIPLFGFLMGVVSFSGERGRDLFLISQPFSSFQFITGKILGLFMTLGGSSLLGFCFAGSVICFEAGFNGLIPFLAFIGLSLLLSLISICQACCITILCKRTIRSFVYILMFWIAQVFLFDIIVLGIISFLNKTGAQLLSYSFLVINPVSLTRFLELLLFGGSHIFGVAGAALVRFLHGNIFLWSLSFTILTAWIIFPVSIAKYSLDRQDI